MERKLNSLINTKFWVNCIFMVFMVSMNDNFLKDLRFCGLHQIKSQSSLKRTLAFVR